MICPQLIEEVDDGLDDGGVLGVQDAERYAAVPPVPVVEEVLGVGGGVVAALEDDAHGDHLLSE